MRVIAPASFAGSSSAVGSRTPTLFDFFADFSFGVASSGTTLELGGRNNRPTLEMLVMLFRKDCRTAVPALLNIDLRRFLDRYFRLWCRSISGAGEKRRYREESCYCLHIIYAGIYIFVKKRLQSCLGDDDRFIRDGYKSGKKRKGSDDQPRTQWLF